MRCSTEFTDAISTLLRSSKSGEERPKLTAKAVEQAEERLGHKLPAAYIALLNVQNGGYVTRRRHPRINGEVEFILGVGDDSDECIGWYSWDEVLEYMAEEGIEEPSELGQMVPFANQGHYLICFDYRVAVGAEPRISFVDIELFEPSVLVAENFEEFVLGLTT